MKLILHRSPNACVFGCKFIYIHYTFLSMPQTQNWSNEMNAWWLSAQRQRTITILRPQKYTRHDKFILTIRNYILWQANERSGESAHFHYLVEPMLEIKTAQRQREFILLLVSKSNSKIIMLIWSVARVLFPPPAFSHPILCCILNVKSGIHNFIQNL